MMNGFLRKVNRLLTYVETPGSIKARFKGCWLDFYVLAYRLRKMGIFPKTILDIGASRGMFTYCTHFVFPKVMIYAFEPLSQCFAELEKLQKRMPNLRCFNVALGDKNIEAVIYKSDYHYSSSLLQMEDLHKNAFPYSVGGVEERVKVERLDDLLVGMNLAKPILVKIDVQGYEKYVLEGARKTLERIDYILCEMSFHILYKNQSLFHDVYTLLIDLGFRFTGPLAQLQHPVTKEVLQIDGFFIRDRKSVV